MGNDVLRNSPGCDQWRSNRSLKRRAQCGLQAQHAIAQVFRISRFGHVFICSRVFCPGNEISAVIAAEQDEVRVTRRACAHRFAHLQPGDLRHFPVENAKVKLLFTQARKGRRSICDLSDFAVHCGKRGRNDPAANCIIISDESAYQAMFLSIRCGHIGLKGAGNLESVTRNTPWVLHKGSINTSKIYLRQNFGWTGRRFLLRSYLPVAIRGIPSIFTASRLAVFSLTMQTNLH